MSRLLFAWLLLAGMFSLLASSARSANAPARQSAIIAPEEDKTLRILALDAATQPDEASIDPGPGHEARTNVWRASRPTPCDRETTGSVFAADPTWGQSAFAEVRPIRGPPVALRA